MLKAAVEGELSKAWREENKDRLEPASELLERILAERRKKWEEDQLAKMRAKGEEPKDDKWKEKYKEPEAVDSSELPELPERWAWATVEQLADASANSITDGPFGSNLKTSHYTDTGPRVVRLQNIASYNFRDEEAHISSDHFEKLGKHEVFEGDIVIRALGEPAPTACLIPNWLGKAIVKADCIRFKPSENCMNTNYAMYALNSPPVQQRTSALLHGVGRPRLNLGEIRSIALPLPPFEEQEKISDDVEAAFSTIFQLEEALQVETVHAGQLRQSLLKKAFSGHLVPQDPNDEPASMLLERIRAEREAKPSINRK